MNAHPHQYSGRVTGAASHNPLAQATIPAARPAMTPHVYLSSKLSFSGPGVAGHDVYNISAPFCDKSGNTYIAGRCERRDSELSHVVFAKADNPLAGKWHVDGNLPRFELQDPCVTVDSTGAILFGGVELVRSGSKIVSWRMPFFAAESVAQLNPARPLFTGPQGMKDIRFCELEPQRLVCFTRPMGNYAGKNYGPGRIGAFITSLSEVTAGARPGGNGEIFASAGVYEKQFLPGEWGGVNFSFVLSNGLVGIGAHKSNYNKFRCREYLAIACALNPVTMELYSVERSTGKVFALKPGNDLPYEIDPATGARKNDRFEFPADIIAVRGDFPAGAVKKHTGRPESDLSDVIFPGGAIREPQSGKARLYAGLSDAEAGVIEIEDCWLVYERLLSGAPLKATKP